MAGMFSTAIGPAKSGFKAIHHQPFGINGSSNPSIPTAIHTYGYFNYSRKTSSKPSYSIKITASAGSIGQEEAVTREEESKSTDDSRRLRRSADWKAARGYQESGKIYEGTIEGSNGGGLLIRFRSLLGFLPFPLISPRHSQNEPQKSIKDIAKDLVGSSISVKIVQASEEGKKLIFSEKDAAWSKYTREIKAGDIFEGRVSKVEDYGAFVDILFPDGYYHVTGLVHVSEISWDLVQDIRDILNDGDTVKVKVTQIDREKARLTLSIKQLEDDPLLESLDDIIPKEVQPESDTHSISNNLNIEPLPGLESICNELLKEDGITEVKVGRRGLEKRVVSQDLELWLSNVPATDKQFILLARAGRQVQEVRMTTILDQDSIKQAVQRVLSRVS